MTAERETCKRLLEENRGLKAIIKAYEQRDVRVREEFDKRQAKEKAQYNIKYDDNIVEIRTGQNIDIDIYSSVECGYVGAGGMHFTYDNPEETTIRLTF